MAREVREKQIGPYLYRVTQLGALEGERWAWKLAKLVVPSMAAAADGFAAAPVKPSEPGSGGTAGAAGREGTEGFAEMLAMFIGASWGVTRLVELVDPAEVELLQLVLAKHTEVVIERDLTPNLGKVFDEHFAGHYDWLAQWFAFALEVNFSSFFAVSASSNARALAGRMVKLMASLSQPPSPPRPGPSTESSQASTTAARA